MAIVRKYGWKPSVKDFRRKKYELHPHLRTAELPRQIDLRDKCPDVYDQLSTSSCTGNMASFLVQYDLLAEGLPDPNPSRLFIYWNARRREGTTASDSGASISDVIAGIAEDGFIPETLWPFDPDKVTVQPPDGDFEVAKTHSIEDFQSVEQSFDHVGAVLADGRPIGLGVSLYESFESDAVAATGIVPVPKRSEKFLGGHAVACIGMDQDTQMFLMRNSWGKNWGLAGYFWLPFSYLLSPEFASDFWVVRKAS
jgi:C1A family cysteine protease